jgi:hypothetical protein
MQNVSTVIRRPVPIGTAAAGGFLAFVAGAVIALAVPVVATGVSVTNPNSSAAASISAVGAEQITHNRSEQGLIGSASFGGQQIAHDRSETGLDK